MCAGNRTGGSNPPLSACRATEIGCRSRCSESSLHARATEVGPPTSVLRADVGLEAGRPQVPCVRARPASPADPQAHASARSPRRRPIRHLLLSAQAPASRSPAIRDLFAAALAAARVHHAFKLFAWVVMPEHVHLLMRPHADARLEAALRSLKTSVAKRVIARWRELDAPILDRIRTSDGAVRFWQKGGGFDRNVRDEDELCREVRYIHRNPVERGLVERPEDWRWSSVRWWMSQREGEIECDPPPGDPRSWAMWKGYM